MNCDRYTLAYRTVQARQVMGWIKAGQCGCLIGLRGAGKSNFLRFLLRQDVHRCYLEQNWSNFTFVLVDLLALTDYTEWAVYELIINRLLKADVETDQEMTFLYQEVIRSRDSLLAQRAVERCVDILCRQFKRRIVLLFDEFDAIFKRLDPALFRCLRAIRDAHKERISYVVVVTEELADVRQDLIPLEHFYRLVGRNVCGLGPYRAADARRMIRHLASQRGVRPNQEDVARLIKLSGGHAGLLKTIFNLFHKGQQENTLTTTTSNLKDEPAVQAECRKVWDSLPESEQSALCVLTTARSPNALILRRLERKGLVQRIDAAPSLFSPVFADFVRQQSPPPTKGIIIHRSPPTVQIDGQHIKNLTELEFALLCYLYEHRDQVCTKDELIQNVYRQRYARMTGGVTDQALQTLISRLRDKIEPERCRSRYIATVRGEGYKFVEWDDKNGPES